MRSIGGRQRGREKEKQRQCCVWLKSKIKKQNVFYVDGYRAVNHQHDSAGGFGELQRRALVSAPVPVAVPGGTGKESALTLESCVVLEAEE